MTGIYRLADLVVRIDSIYDRVHKQCGPYRTDGVPVFAVRTEREDIARERERAERADIRAGRKRTVYDDAYLETLCVCRGIAERAPEHGVFLFHGSAIAVDGQAYIFTAPSGTGKSTHTRLWRQMLGGRAVMINDDKPLIRVLEDGSAIACGTPWDGKHHLSGNIAAPLRAICLLQRSPENRIRPVGKAEALPALVQQTYRPADPAARAKTLALLGRLETRLYRLDCNMEAEAAEMSYRALSGERQ